ncbi:hypothetical protein F5J12DRAFT_347429 [Pisolithus orientalis]|uniref:uncharacterized protein n=1 Tax=Pisolithus orientalis TaxID=936130 RepID=UPI00222400FB|nr:uncharacterized protein F5J12DRAFT_347429 [Pisolithus orientalis]KAI5996874.1 hypothetical protein F5J12DRAFT_347429 [Pisolithus orientalis]
MDQESEDASTIELTYIWGLKKGCILTALTIAYLPRPATTLPPDTYKLPKRYGHPRWVWFCPHFGFGLCCVIWHNNSPGTYAYFMHYSTNDTSVMKFLVAATILETLHVSLMCHILYYYLITNYGIPTSLEYVVWSYPASFLVIILVVSVVQLFFAHKIYCLCRPRLKWLLTIPIILLVLVRFGSGMVLGVFMFVHNEATVFTQTRFSLVIPTGSPLILSESLITVSLCVLLYGGSRDGFPRMKRLLHTLIIYAVNRCLLTLLVAIAMDIMTVEVQVSWAMGLDFIIGRLYANSLLASLNTRQYLQSQSAEPSVDIHIDAINFADPQRLSGQGESSKDGERQFGV